MDWDQRLTAWFTSKVYEDLNQGALSCGTIKMVMVELVHVPPSVGMSAPEAARTGVAERKPVIKTKRTMRRTKALNARILFRTRIRHKHGLFVGFSPIDYA